MGIILNSLRNTIIVGLIVTAVIWYFTRMPSDTAYITFLVRWLHVLSGVMWIGLLWYFNFVQIPNMGNIPDDQKPAISKVIAPAALFWFRWGAASTVLFGLILAHLNGYLHEAMTFSGGVWLIGLGMWFGLIMAFNVWFLIWPAQKKALGIVEADPESKAKAAATAKTFSRINTLLSVPMLYCMVGAQNAAMGM